MKLIIIRSILTNEVIDSVLSNDELEPTQEMKDMLDNSGFYITTHPCDLVRDSKRLMGKILNCCNFELMDESDIIIG